MPPKMNQQTRQPLSPQADRTRGTTAPENMSPSAEPATAIPEASPRRRLANHAGSSAITGTLLAPLPIPVSTRQATASGNPPAAPVSIMPAAATASPAAMTTRGP